MSRSNNVEIKNPAQRFFEWSGDEGTFFYFDKTLIDDEHPKGTRVKVPLPFNFLVLDVLATVTGYNEPDGVGIYSNEIKEIKTQKLTVKTFKGREIASGLYEAIKDRCTTEGGGYTSSVYIAYFEGKELKIGHIKIRGAALGAWIDYGKKLSFYKGAISVPSFTEGKKGRVEFKIPVFKQIEVSAATDETAKYLDTELQDYLKKYFARNNQATIEKDVITSADASQDSKGEEHYSQEAPEYTLADAPPEKDEEVQDLPF